MTLDPGIEIIKGEWAVSDEGWSIGSDRIQPLFLGLHTQYIVARTLGMRDQ